MSCQFGLDQTQELARQHASLKFYSDRVTERRCAGCLHRQRLALLGLGGGGILNQKLFKLRPNYGTQWSK